MKYRIIENGLKECGDISDEQLAIFTYIARKAVENQNKGKKSIWELFYRVSQGAVLKRKEIGEMKRLGLLKSRSMEDCVKEIGCAVRVEIKIHCLNENGKPLSMEGRMADFCGHICKDGKFYGVEIVPFYQAACLALGKHEYEEEVIGGGGGMTFQIANTHKLP